MKFSSGLFAFSAVALCAATATAFTVGPRNAELSKRSDVSLKMADAVTTQETFAKTEIESNDVSLNRSMMRPVLWLFFFCLTLLVLNVISFRSSFFRNPTVHFAQEQRISFPSSA